MNNSAVIAWTNVLAIGHHHGLVAVVESTSRTVDLSLRARWTVIAGGATIASPGFWVRNC